MKKVRITAIRQTIYSDLMKIYENPIEHTCDVKEGMQWISVNGKCPEGMCPSAWSSMREFVESLAQGKGNFYDGWMKNPMSAMISCNDGFRPFSFYIETIDEALPQQSTAPLSLTHPSIDKAEERVHKLVMNISDKTMPRRQIIAYLGLKQNSRRTFVSNYLKPAIAKGYVCMAYPNSPNKPEQAYYLSETGLELLKKLKSMSYPDKS